VDRFVLKVCGESGMGLRSVGQILTKSLKRFGYYVHSDREYPSLIKGGHSMVQVDFSTQPVRSLSTNANIQVALDYAGLMNYLDTIKPGGILMHSFEKHAMIPELEKMAAERDIQLVFVPARETAYALGGNHVVVNMVMVGFAWGVLGLKLKPLQTAVEEQFADKPKLLEIDLKCIEAGYQMAIDDTSITSHELPEPDSVPDQILIDGNTAIALGAIQAGVRAYYAYPMSPASSILSDLAEFAHESGMLVKQVEDEITAAQMCLGSMHMGTRALTATSGGGVDLMTETMSLAGMTEIPFVMVYAQRTGPATGLPTWTGQAGLNLAVYGAHGEFPRVVIAVSDPSSAYELTQHALNIAEKYQLVVMLLTEKVIAESQSMVDPFQHGAIPIERGLITDEAALKKLTSNDRYQITDSGVSPRWLPGSGAPHYFANGDEHWLDGQVTEEAEEAHEMVAKRMRKQKTVLEALPEPQVYGVEKGASVSFVGWGSTKNTMLDVIAYYKEQGVSVNYLHFDYVFPLKTKRLKRFFAENETVCLIEGNHTAQFGTLVEDKTNLTFHKKFLKWNGRPFYYDEVIGFVESLTS
jgi:2-oxoglutarate ferredoxin oxidoreductase subunit alpha